MRNEIPTGSTNRHKHTVTTMVTGNPVREKVIQKCMNSQSDTFKLHADHCKISDHIHQSHVIIIIINDSLMLRMCVSSVCLITVHVFVWISFTFGNVLGEKPQKY